MELPMDGSAGSTARLERRVKSKRCKRGTSHRSSKGAQNEADGELQKVSMVSSERMARGAGCWGATQSCGGGHGDGLEAQHRGLRGRVGSGEMLQLGKGGGEERSCGDRAPGGGPPTGWAPGDAHRARRSRSRPRPDGAARGPPAAPRPLLPLSPGPAPRIHSRSQPRRAAHSARCRSRPPPPAGRERAARRHGGAGAAGTGCALSGARCWARCGAGAAAAAEPWGRRPAGARPCPPAAPPA